MSEQSKLTLDELIAEMDGRFRSGNDVPVQRAQIKDHEWELLKKHLKL